MTAFLELLRGQDAAVVGPDLRERLPLENALPAMRFEPGAYLAWSDGAPGDHVLAAKLPGGGTAAT